MDNADSHIKIIMEMARLIGQKADVDELRQIAAGILPIAPAGDAMGYQPTGSREDSCSEAYKPDLYAARMESPAEGELRRGLQEERMEKKSAQCAIFNF